MDENQKEKTTAETIIDELIPALLAAAQTEGKKTLKFSKDLIARVYRAFWTFILLAFFVPLILIIFDLAFKTGWLTGIAGILLSATLMVLLLNPFYLGLSAIIGAALTEKFKLKNLAEAAFIGGKIYIDTALSILLWELIITTYLSVVPIWKNPRALPIMIMGSILAGLMSYCWKINFGKIKTLAFILVVGAMIRATLSCMFFETATIINEKKGSLDHTIAQQIKNKGIIGMLEDITSNKKPDADRIIIYQLPRVPIPLPPPPPKPAELQLSAKDKAYEKKEIEKIKKLAEDGLNAPF